MLKTQRQNMLCLWFITEKQQQCCWVTRHRGSLHRKQLTTEAPRWHYAFFKFTSKQKWAEAEYLYPSCEHKVKLQFFVYGLIIWASVLSPDWQFATDPICGCFAVCLVRRYDNLWQTLQPHFKETKLLLHIYTVKMMCLLLVDRIKLALYTDECLHVYICEWTVVSQPVSVCRGRNTVSLKPSKCCEEVITEKSQFLR